MNTIQKCNNTSDAAPFYASRNLFLKPIARALITVRLPHFQKLIGKSVSTLELIENLKELIKPDEFMYIKVVTSTVCVVEFEAEVETRAILKKVLAKLDNKFLKMKQFKEQFKVIATESKQKFPSCEDWNGFFRDTKDMNERKPGERPDTVYVAGLPISWFSEGFDDELPCEKLFFEVFRKFGEISRVDIPICDPYRKKMKHHISGMKTYNFEEKQFFEGYIQFLDYSGFTKAMSTLRGMKLLRKISSGAQVVEIQVDFDRSKHLSSSSLRRREIVQSRLRQIQRDCEEQKRRELEERLKMEEKIKRAEVSRRLEKEARKQLREEKRKAKLLAKLNLKKGNDTMNEKIAREECKILKAQRMLESIRLIEALFRRVHKTKISAEQKGKKLQEIIKDKGKLLKSVVSFSKDASSSSDREEHESSDTDVPEKVTTTPAIPPLTTPTYISGPIWCDYSTIKDCNSCASSLQRYSAPHHLHSCFPRNGRGAPFNRGRWFNRFLRDKYPHSTAQVLQNYPPSLQEEYVRYFSKFLDRNGTRYSKSRSRTRSRGRSRSRTRSRDHSRSRSLSKDRRRHDKRSKSRKRSRSRSSRGSRSYSRSRSTSRRRSRSKSGRSKSRTSTSNRKKD